MVRFSFYVFRNTVIGSGHERQGRGDRDACRQLTKGTVAPAAATLVNVAKLAVLQCSSPRRSNGAQSRFLSRSEPRLRL
jgi:hypothetical protein